MQIAEGPAMGIRKFFGFRRGIEGCCATQKGRKQRNLGVFQRVKIYFTFPLDFEREDVKIRPLCVTRKGRSKADGTPENRPKGKEESKESRKKSRRKRLTIRDFPEILRKCPVEKGDGRPEGSCPCPWGVRRIRA